MESLAFHPHTKSSPAKKKAVVRDCPVIAMAVWCGIGDTIWVISFTFLGILKLHSGSNLTLWKEYSDA